MLSMTRWNPFEEIGSLHRELDRVFGHYVGDAASPPAEAAWAPATEVRSGEHGWTVRMAVPGIDPKQIHIDLRGNTLRISGERTRTGEDGQGYPSELHYGRFERTFTLPAKVDAEQVTASYDHGMLALTLPLAEAAKPRRIAIDTAAPSHGVTVEHAA